MIRTCVECTILRLSRMTQVLMDRVEDACGREELANFMYGETVSWLECREISYTSTSGVPLNMRTCILFSITCMHAAPEFLPMKALLRPDISHAPPCFSMAAVAKDAPASCS
jgi:hypothetical protein